MERVREAFDAVVVRPEFVNGQAVTLGNALARRDVARRQLRGHGTVYTNRRGAVDDAPSFVTCDQIAWCMSRLHNVHAGVRDPSTLFFMATSNVVPRLYDETDPLSLGTVLGILLKPSSDQERLATLRELAVLFASRGCATDAIDRKCAELQAALSASLCLD